MGSPSAIPVVGDAAKAAPYRNVPDAARKEDGKNPARAGKAKGKGKAPEKRKGKGYAGVTGDVLDIIERVMAGDNLVVNQMIAALRGELKIEAEADEDEDDPVGETGEVDGDRDEDGYPDSIDPPTPAGPTGPAKPTGSSRVAEAAPFTRRV